MKTTILTFAMISAAASLRAQDLKPVDQREAQRQLLKIEEDIGRANRECNYAYFRRIEADEFIFTGADGKVTTRADDLAGEKDCKRRSYPQTIDEPRVLFYGSVAVINARNTITTTDSKGQPVPHRNRFTDVFVWRDGRWQLVSGHSSRIVD